MQRPQPRLIRSPRDAEEVAAEWMAWMGFEGARPTGLGVDEGIDVVSESAVAQVKAEMKPTGRPALQAIFGAASVVNKQAVFFSLAGYTPEATEFAHSARIALFTFDLSGQPEPANHFADRLVAANPAAESSACVGDAGQERGGPQRNGMYVRESELRTSGVCTNLVRYQDFAPYVVSSGERTVLLDSSGRVSCFRSLGRTDWERVVSCGVLHAPPAIADGSVVVGGTDPNEPVRPGNFAQLRCLDLASGSERWTQPVAGVLTNRMVLAGDAVYAIVDQVDDGEATQSVLTSFALQSGRPRWTASLGLLNGAKPKLASDGNIVIAGYLASGASAVVNGMPRYMQSAAHFGSLRAFDSHGTALWSNEDVGVEGVAIAGRTVLADVARPDPWFRGLVALDVANGQVLREIARSRDPHPLFATEDRFVTDGSHVWIGGFDLRCESLMDGSARWSRSAEVLGGPVADLVLSDGRLLLLVVPDGRPTEFVELDPYSGAEYQRCAQPEVHVILGVRNDGSVLVGTSDRSRFAVGLVS